MPDLKNMLHVINCNFPLYLKDIPDAEVDQLLETKEKEIPRIVVFRSDGEIISTYISW